MCVNIYDNISWHSTYSQWYCSTSVYSSTYTDGTAMVAGKYLDITKNERYASFWTVLWYNKGLCDLYRSSGTDTILKCMRFCKVGHMAEVDETRNTYRILAGNLLSNNHSDNWQCARIPLSYILGTQLVKVVLTQDQVQWQSLV